VCLLWRRSGRLTWKAKMYRRTRASSVRPYFRKLTKRKSEQINS
jgi:hypothetical protein